MSTYAQATVLSRSGVFHRLGSLLTDVSSINSQESQIPYSIDQTINNDILDFETSFAQLSYRQDLSTIEHIHIRCRPASSFDPSIHTSLCEVVLGIYPDTNLSTSSSPASEQPVIVRGVVERRHRRIKVGDWLLAINGNRVDCLNLNNILSKYSSTRKVRLTVRHPEIFNSKFSLLPPPSTILSPVEEKKLTLPEQIECIHSVLYYQKKPNEGFELLFQHPSQKDLFFAVGCVFPTLLQVMHDMNEHDSLLRR